MRRVGLSRFALTRVVVFPKYRGKGGHLALIKIRLDIAKDCGAREVVTFTMCHNTASTNNLIDCGFRTYKPKRIPHAAKWSPIYLKHTFKE